MATVVQSDGELKYFDTFAALADYTATMQAVVEDVVETETTYSPVTLQLTNSDADTIVNIDSDVVVVDASKRKKPISITGNDLNNDITGGKGADTLSGGNGDDILKGGAGKDVFIYSGGNDIITDYVSGTDKIKLSNAIIKSVTPSTDSNGNGDLYFSIEGGGSITIENIVKKDKSKKITLIDSRGNETSQIFGVETLTIADSDGDKFDLSLNSSVEIANASKRKKAIYITGNNNDCVLKGGKGADTLKGHYYSDDTLTGGSGADVFIYSGGEDVITDYNYQQKDTIRLSNAKYQDFSFDGNNVIIETSEGNITILNSKNKNITYYDEKGQVITRNFRDSAEYVIEKNYKSDSYNANSKTSTFKQNLITINASLVKNSLALTGNANDNLIIGTNSGDTLFGYNGDDTLTGGKGKDVFIHESGNDVITDYTSEQDIIRVRNTTLDGASISADSQNDIVLTFKNKSTLTIKNAIKISGKKKTYKKLTIYDETKKQQTVRAYCEENVTLTDSSLATYNATSSLNSNVVKINASSRKKAIKITGNAKGNIIQTGNGKDTINTGTASSTVLSGAGNDYIKGNIGDDSLVGGKGNDLIYGQAGADIIDGGDGIDTIYSGAGDDILFGGKGDDILHAESGENTLNAGKGNDTIYAGTGNDVIIYNSGDGNDVIVNYQEQDTIQLGKKLSVKSSEVKGNDYILTIGNNKLTFKDSANKTINVITAKEERKSFRAQRSYDEWFAQDDVLATNDLSSILKADSVDISLTDNFETFDTDSFKDVNKIQLTESK